MENTPPLLLDLYCCAGGAATGYHRAGFDVIGIDNKPQPRYPFTFIQGDALRPPVNLAKFAAIHASPPCQGYSWSARKSTRLGIKREYLIEDTRALLKASGLPYIIENVIGAPLIKPLRLCGEMFSLRVVRHRLFESNIFIPEPDHLPHRGTVRDGTYVTVAGHGGDNAIGCGSRAVKQAAMGIDWTSDQELNEAVPPAYTEYIGRWLLEAVRTQKP